MTWLKDAACKGKPMDWWFTERSPRVTDHAKRICAGCAVREECQSFAMRESIKDGVWGGLTGEERERVKSRARRARRVAAGGKP